MLKCKCGVPQSNSKQSPINIALQDVVRVKQGTKMNWEYEPAKSAILLTNTGHGWHVRFFNHKSELTGGPLQDKYVLEEINCHWGSSSDYGSEHYLDGQKFSGELHLVHWNKKYSDINAAMTHSDGLCIMAVFMKVGTELHEELEKIARRRVEIDLRDDAVKLKKCLDPAKFIPNKSPYFTYEGSLTVAPYLECVTWIVFKEPILVAETQLDSFRKMKSFSRIDLVPNEGGGFVRSNCRGLRPVGNRVYNVTNIMDMSGDGSFLILDDEYKQKILLNRPCSAGARTILTNLKTSGVLSSTNTALGCGELKLWNSYFNISKSAWMPSEEHDYPNTMHLSLGVMQ